MDGGVVVAAGGEGAKGSKIFHIISLRLPSYLWLAEWLGITSAGTLAIVLDAS